MSDSTKEKLEENIVALIKSGEIKMKPRWYFLLGSLAMVIGLIALVILLIFLVSLIAFSLRTHGPMGELRYQELVSSFPGWAPILALAGLYFGAKVFKKFDFSYKKNFLSVVIAVVAIIIISGWLINYLGLDNIWLKRGPLKGMYQQYDGGMMRGSGRRMMQNNLR
ncbi:MAG: hypothetical protein NTY12_05235 [Candidatus Falkowbacteria bacterium]|nr:hypothetical protein [Candidatus Falkowbacteria bacterium]